MTRDSIFALATAPGRAGVAVLRLSGPDADAALSALTASALPLPRMASLRRLRSPATGEILDEALVLRFPKPGSFTGEDVVELHLHGGRAVVADVVQALSALPGLRPAEPGEFTRRAFENGRLDLTEAEAIADLVDAETGAQRRQALRQLDGALGRLYQGWADGLTRALAHLEADIEFPDEDLPSGISPAVLDRVRTLAGEIDAHLRTGHRGERVREGIYVAIVGAPNAGKSSLLNALAGRDVAIVSAHAGTTRDIIEVQLDLRGYPVVLADTAGLRETADEIESEGIRRALDRAERADLRVALFDATATPVVDAATERLVDDRTLVAVNKVDRAGDAPAVAASRPAIHISARTGAGIPELLDELGRRVEHAYMPTGAPSLTRARHRQALEDARAALSRAVSAPLPELAAEDLRMAVRAIGRITGRVDVEAVLDVIFADFCIGK